MVQVLLGALEGVFDAIEKLLMQDEATHFPVGAGNAGSGLMVDAQYSTSGGRCLWIHCSTEGRRHW